MNVLQLLPSAMPLYYTLANKQTGCVHESETSHPSHKDTSTRYSGPVTATASACASFLDYDRSHTIEYAVTISFQAKEVG